MEKRIINCNRYDGKKACPRHSCSNCTQKTVKQITKDFTNDDWDLLMRVFV